MSGRRAECVGAMVGVGGVDSLACGVPHQVQCGKRWPRVGSRYFLGFTGGPDQVYLAKKWPKKGDVASQGETSSCAWPHVASTSWASQDQIEIAERAGRRQFEVLDAENLTQHFYDQSGGDHSPKTC